MTVVGKKYIVAIYYRYPARQVNGSIYIYIYIQTKSSWTTLLINALKGKFFPGKRVFFGGIYCRENGAWKAFGASVLNKF